MFKDKSETVGSVSKWLETGYVGEGWRLSGTIEALRQREMQLVWSQFVWHLYLSLYLSDPNLSGICICLCICLIPICLAFVFV